MALPFGVSWLCTLLLWLCICFSPQKGYNIVHGYSFNDDGFSRHADVPGPQTSDQFHSGVPLNTNHDSVVSPGDEMQAMRHQSSVSPQREPVHHDNHEDASSVTSLSEEMVQNKTDSEHEQESSGYQHPFGLLVKEHTQEQTMEGISFPTIKDLKRFIETMKISFLTPGSDLSTHFQTARETMEKEIDAQNTEGEAAREGTAHVDVSENEVWSEPMNTEFEQSGNYQMPSENPSAHDPVDSTVSLTSTSVYDNQDLGPGSALHPRPHLAATEHVSSNYGSFDNGGISGENRDIFTSAPDVRHEDVQSTSYILPEQMPSDSFFEGDFSFHPSQDFSYYSSTTSNIAPLNSEKNIQQPQYTSQSKDSFTSYQKPSGGFELGEDLQSEALGTGTPANSLSAPKLPSLNSYGKSIYVNAPRGQLHIPDYIPKHRERPAPSFQVYQPTVRKESTDINYTPTVHLPAFSGFVSSSSENLTPQSSSGHVGVQTSSPRDAQNRLVFTVKPPSSLHGSSRHDGYLRDQSVGVTRPSILTAQAKNEEKSDPSEENLVSATQEPKQMTDNIPIPISGGLDSTQSGISSRVRDASFNSLTNLAPASESVFSRLTGNEDMSRNFRIKNIISDRFLTGAIHGTRNPLGSFSTRGMSLNGDYVGATRAGLLQTFIQPIKVRKRPAKVNKEPSTTSYQPPKPRSASKVSGSNLGGVFRRNGGNTKRLPPQTDLKMSPPVNAYVMKSRRSYVRGKVSLSKTSYAPYQLDEGKTGKHQWKPAPRQQSKYKNTAGPHVKGFKEQ